MGAGLAAPAPDTSEVAPHTVGATTQETEELTARDAAVGGGRAPPAPKDWPNR